MGAQTMESRRGGLGGLVRITELSARLGLSSRSLRYYEQAGLIKSVRPAFEKYRFYDAENVERLKQIVVLRKMQIPVKDIMRIYESESMSVVVETFVSRIRAIDDEIGALSELKRIVGEFLQTMLDNGITKISAIPLLYDEMDKQLVLMEERKPVTYDDLSGINERLAKPAQPAIVHLPAMRVVSSYLKANPAESDAEGFWRWAQARKLLYREPARHELFEFQTGAGDVVMLRVPGGFDNDGGYLDYIFEGGLFAAENVYIDEDIGERFRSLVRCFDDNKYYEVDYRHDGSMRHPAMLENLISPDDRRELAALLVPVKKRTPDHTLFGKPAELPPGSVSISEIEEANPVLWEAAVPLDRLTPVNYPHYRMTENGEAEFIGSIIRNALNTNVSVRLPFRVDIEFRQTRAAVAGGLVVYQNEEIDYRMGDLGNMGFGINMGNNANQAVQAISFRQPVFGDHFLFPRRGAIEADGLNKLTWIVGEKHLAVIINGEIRYCGADFPYMSLDLSREAARPIVIGSHGGSDTKYFRSIRVSQLAESKKNKLKDGELIMVTKQSNNVIPIIHRLVTDEYGENYWFNGCAKYIMECLGEPDYDYWFFAGLTGDVFTQHYSFTKYSGDAVSSYMMDEKPAEYVEEIFAKCGYAATFVPKRDIRKNTEMYLKTLIAYIDKGVPVGKWDNSLGVFVGYEDYGKVLLYITGNSNQPERTTLEKALEGKPDADGWIFAGVKKESRPLAGLYREAIRAIPQFFGVRTESYCFGPEAFSVWAADIENGKFDGMTVDEFDIWSYHTNYVCVLATNGSCCHEFLKRAWELNPDMAYLEQVGALYRRMAEMWGGDRNRNDADSLEALGGGFNITLDALQDKERRGKIAAKIREFAAVTNEILQVLKENL